MFSYSGRLSSPIQSNCRQFWQYVYVAFNRVDVDRKRFVSADRLCAEWILKNGGTVTFANRPDKVIDNYNFLPKDCNRLSLKSIDATNTAIMAIGFEHLYGCKEIEKIVLDNCQYMENEALTKLCSVKDSLRYLQITGCPNVESSGLLALGCLHRLRMLALADMPYVDNLTAIINRLQQKLPDCEFFIKI